MDRATILTKYLKRYDRELYCVKSREGKLCVYRNSTIWEHYSVKEGCSLSVARSAPYFILALTDNWKEHGRPVDWGSLPLIKRIEENDLHKRDLASEIIAREEKNIEAQERHRKNQSEGFFSEFHGQFKKTFSDYNTSSMKKIDRRRKDEFKHK